MPIRNVGRLTPTSDPASRSATARCRASARCRRRAESRRQSASSAATNDSSSVAGSRSFSSVGHRSALAQRLAELALHGVADEAPELHVRTAGRARGRRAAARVLRASRPGPTMKLTGSPVKLNSPKAMNATTAITATDCRMRRRTKASKRARQAALRSRPARGPPARRAPSDDAQTRLERQCSCGRARRETRRICGSIPSGQDLPRHAPLSPHPRQPHHPDLHRDDAAGVLPDPDRARRPDRDHGRRARHRPRAARGAAEGIRARSARCSCSTASTSAACCTATSASR